MAIEHLKDTTSAVALGREIVELDEQITQLKADLSKFGGHTDKCGASGWNPTWQNQTEPPCDCGYAEAEERWI